MKLLRGARSLSLYRYFSEAWLLSSQHGGECAPVVCAHATAYANTACPRLADLAWNVLGGALGLLLRRRGGGGAPPGKVAAE